jgi:hypothetical protein
MQASSPKYASLSGIHCVGRGGPRASVKPKDGIGSRRHQRFKNHDVELDGASAVGGAIFKYLEGPATSVSRYVLELTGLQHKPAGGWLVAVGYTGRNEHTGE